MAKGLTLKAKHFKATRPHCVYGFGWVSNGHWMLKLDRVANAAVFEGEPAAVAAALGLAADSVHRFETADAVERIVRRVGGTVPFVVSALSVDVRNYRKGDTIARLAFSEAGEPLSLNSAYCELLGISAGDTIAATVNGGAYSSPDADAVSWVLMPLQFDSAQLARDLGRPVVEALARTFEPEQVVGGPGGNDPEPAASPRPVMDWAAVQTTMAEASALALAAVAEGRGEFAAFAARKAAHWAFVLSLRIDQQETERRAA